MVLHHTTQYFYRDPAAVIPVRFVSGAFVLLAGFFSTYIYLQRGTDSSALVKSGGRLVFRGCRLFLLYTLINLVLVKHAGTQLAPEHRMSASRLAKLFWNGDFKDAMFSLLAPIAYTLVVVGIFFMLKLVKPGVLLTCAMVLTGYCVFLFNDMASGYILRYFVFGLLGAYLGAVPVVCKFLLEASVWLGAAGFILSLAIQWWLGTNYFIYICIVLTSVCLLFGVGRLLPQKNWFTGVCDVLGDYTLLAYLAHIVILQALRRSLPFFENYFAVLALFGLLSTVLYGILMLTSRIRKDFKGGDRVYRAIFA
jgi:hypothetical protein